MDNNNVFTTSDGKTYDMSVPNLAESRVHEIAYITRTKAPELISLFSRACFILSRHLTALYYAHQMAKKAAANRRAVVTLDITPGVLAEKKLGNNEANRQAVIDLDSEYDRLSTIEIELEAAVLFVRRKIEDMESALNATKKVVGDAESVYNRPNYNWSETGTQAEPELQQEPSSPAGLMFGKPKY